VPCRFPRNDKRKKPRACLPGPFANKPVSATDFYFHARCAQLDTRTVASFAALFAKLTTLTPDLDAITPFATAIGLNALFGTHHPDAFLLADAFGARSLRQQGYCRGEGGRQCNEAHRTLLLFDGVMSYNRVMPKGFPGGPKIIKENQG
jgi:hypothetical protein